MEDYTAIWWRRRREEEVEGFTAIDTHSTGFEGEADSHMTLVRSFVYYSSNCNPQIRRQPSHD